MLLELTLTLILSAPPPGDATPATGRRAQRPAAAPNPAAPPPAPAPAPTPPAEVKPPAVPAEDTPDEDAAVLQARALLAEHDGKLVDALALLRQAHERSPGNGDVTYDLARVAALAAGPAPVAGRDVDPFLARTAETAPERVLRGYLLARRGDLAGAREQLATVARLEPGRGELAAFEAPPRGVAAAVRVGLFGQYDSNVLLVAGGAPSDVGGPRMSLDADAELTFGEAAPWLRAGAFGRLGVHAANRVNLGDYDSGTLGLFVRAGDRVGPVDYDVMLSGTDVGVNAPSSKQFVQEGALRGTATLATGALRPGLFVALGYRNFVSGNPAGVENRDGPFAAGGLLAEWGERRLALAAQLGYQLEQAQGDEQRERGVMAGLLARSSFGPVVAGLGVDYQMRDYAQSRTGRRDHLLTPSVSASVPTMTGLRLVAAYSFTKNISSAGFGYDRHLAQLGVEGHW